jgi:ceramide glucosyltransferase
VIALALAAVLLGAWVYCVLTIVAVRRQFRSVGLSGAGPWPAAASQAASSGLTAGRPETPQAKGLPHISILKPLAGAEPLLESNLRSFFAQDYPAFELLFAVRRDTDPAIAIVSVLQREFPYIPSRLIVTGEPPYANAKVFSLSNLTALASHDWVVMSDSDVGVSHDFLRKISAEIDAGTYDIATCPYRAVPGSSLWPRLEALGMNTEFWGSAFVAKMMEGVRFTVGPTVVARRAVFNRIPWDTLSPYLAEDFVLGQRAAELGFRVDLSRVVVEHHLIDESFRDNMAHRLRWARSTRRSRPWGYLGQVFTNPLPVALLLLAADLRSWPALVVTAVLRAASAFATANALHDTLSRRYALLIPIQDLLSFVFWLAGFTGNIIAWRGRRYRLHRDGTFEPV